MKTLKLFFLLNSLLVIFSIQANALEERLCIISPVTIHYSNGVFNTPEDAQNSLDTIRIIVKRDLAAEGLKFGEEYWGCFNGYLEFELQYNGHDGVADILEATAQSWIGEFSKFWRTLSTNSESEEARVLYEKISNLVDRAQYAVAPEIADYVEYYTQSDQVDIDLYNNGDHLLKKKILRNVISHSQGNYFSNIIYKELPPEVNSIYRLISVATPDYVVGLSDLYILTHPLISFGEPGYTSLITDSIINGIRENQEIFGLTPALPGNMTAGPGADYWGHSFLGSYMIPNSESYNFIIDKAKRIPRVMHCPLPPSQISDSDLYDRCICEALNDEDGIVTEREELHCSCFVCPPEEDQHSQCWIFCLSGD